MKKGNTLASLAMVLNACYRSWYGTKQDVLYECLKFDSMISNNGQYCINTGVIRAVLNSILPWFCIINTLVPYYSFFFEKYRLSQKLHVLRMMSNHQIYDEGLF